MFTVRPLTVHWVGANRSMLKGRGGQKSACSDGRGYPQTDSAGLIYSDNWSEQGKNSWQTLVLFYQIIYKFFNEICRTWGTRLHFWRDCLRNCARDLRFVEMYTKGAPFKSVIIFRLFPNLAKVSQLLLSTGYDGLRSSTLCDCKTK